MKELYNEFFRIPEQGKIRDKVMLTRVAVIIAVLVICLVAMSTTAYAYFTYNVSSGTNLIQAASFDTTISVKMDGVTEVLPENGEADSLAYALQAGKSYTVTAAPSDDSTVKTGFLIITADDCGVEYHTEQLFTNGTAPEQITFTLTVSADTKVVFEPRWGTSAYYDAYINDSVNEECYILNRERIQISVQTLAINTDEEQTTTTTTENSVTTTTTNATSSTAETTTETTAWSTTEAVSETTTTVQTSADMTQTSETTTASTSVTEPSGDEILH